MDTPLEDLRQLAETKEVLIEECRHIEINRVKKFQEKKEAGNSKFEKERSRGQEKSCYACGKGNHIFKTQVCKFKSYTCMICKKKGHIMVLRREEGPD